MGERLHKTETQCVAQCHFGNTRSNAALFYSCRRFDLSFKNQLMHPAQIFPQYRKIQYIPIQQRRAQEHDFVPGLLKFAGNRFSSVNDIYCKRYQRRRHMQIHKAAGHAVLAAYRRNLHTVQYRVGA